MEYMKRIMNSLYVTGEGDFSMSRCLKGKQRCRMVPVTYGREYGGQGSEHGTRIWFSFCSSDVTGVLPIIHRYGRLIGDQSEILANNLKEVTVLATGNIDESARHILNMIPLILC